MERSSQEPLVADFGRAMGVTTPESLEAFHARLLPSISDSDIARLEAFTRSVREHPPPSRAEKERVCGLINALLRAHSLRLDDVGQYATLCVRGGPRGVIHARHSRGSGQFKGSETKIVRVVRKRTLESAYDP